jgi:nitroimidazol reductase NimA-like FMN-containing flavoprotein (pyridoxamine 5'-phosphate oxidase superfamily)
MSSYGTEILDQAQCDALLGTQRVGRVGVFSGRPAVLPVIYALLDGDVVFRTAPGEKLIAAGLNRDVVFEIDAFDVTQCSGWSVNVLGTAEEILDANELARVNALDLQAWAGEFRDRVIRIRAQAVSGRRVQPAA